MSSNRSILKKSANVLLCCSVLAAVVWLSVKSPRFRQVAPGLRQMIEHSEQLRGILASLGEGRAHEEDAERAGINPGGQRIKDRNITSRVDEDHGKGKGLPSTKNTTTPSFVKRKTTLDSCRDAFVSEFEKEKRFICSNINGGIGNRMFAFASAYGMASAVNKTVVMVRTNFLITHFNLKAEVVGDFCVCNTAHRVGERRRCSFTEAMMNLTERLNYRAGNYLQSWKYFRHVVKDIREMFTFKPSVQRMARVIIQNKLKEIVFRTVTDARQNVVTVGVHIRRGNMVPVNGTMGRGYNPPPPSYFKNAMDYYRGKYKTVAFIVCSNGMEWCRRHLTGNDVTFVEGNSYDVDLAVLSHCHHSIISIGTFGWWAAFLAAGDVIYYAHPAKAGSGYAKQFSKDKSDYFYPGWIALE